MKIGWTGTPSELREDIWKQLTPDARLSVLEGEVRKQGEELGGLRRKAQQEQEERERVEHENAGIKRERDDLKQVSAQVVASELRPEVGLKPSVHQAHDYSHGRQRPSDNADSLTHSN